MVNHDAAVTHDAKVLIRDIDGATVYPVVCDECGKVSPDPQPKTVQAASDLAAQHNLHGAGLVR